MGCISALKILAVVVTTCSQLTACSKTVQWTEEVPLNTGEVIWVIRTATYSPQGAGGNPFDIAYRVDSTETLAFEWRGKGFIYKGDASLMLIAISPAGVPVIVAPASNGRWDWRNNYLCASPHYVQFIPDRNGSHWFWPSSIEPWLYGLPYNLMYQRGSAGEMKARYSAVDRQQEDSIVAAQSQFLIKIDPNFVSSNCKKR